MKKISTFLFLLIVCTMKTFAQSALVATLAHGSSLTTYYGESAFTEAYAAAADGDCITLSAGTFTAVETIEKAITIRGAGMKGDGTTLSGVFTINIALKSASPLVIEGLYTNISAINGAATQIVQFVKVRTHVGCAVSISGCSVTFMHCIIYNPTLTADVHVNFYNSLINNLCNTYDSRQYGSLNVQNCLVECSRIVNSSSSNCIFLFIDSGGDVLASSNTVEHCVGWHYVNFDLFSNISNRVTDTMVSDLSDLFKNYRCADLLDESNFELTDAAKAAYKGSDGTEVGIFGGANPYTTATTNPRITNFSITTNTEGGQLKVKLNVE